MVLPIDIARSFSSGQPFAVFRLPGDTTIRVADRDNEFHINMWNTPFSSNISVNECRSGLAAVQPWAESTPHDRYINSTHQLIGRLRSRGGKCVRMRAICASGKIFDINAIVEDVFNLYPDAFCHCYYTPHTGLWLGATPELLLDYDGKTMRTMSLAGTRSADRSGQWDEKNKQEQAFVTEFICESLTKLGLQPHCGVDETLRYGAIEHICTRIEAALKPGVVLEDILNALSPTPAVAGLPRFDSLAEIEKIEDAPRRCYAGYVMYRGGGGQVKAYVNLRCAQFSENAYCIYAGGGVTAESDAESEWSETSAKGASLVDIFERNTIDDEPQQ